MDKKANARRHLFEEAKKLGLLVRDAAGEPYMMPNTAFDVAMLDFTNPAARAWFKGEVLAVMARGGAAGWMADFGEGLPLNARLHSSGSGDDGPVAAHNRYRSCGRASTASSPTSGAPASTAASRTTPTTATATASWCSSCGRGSGRARGGRCCSGKGTRW